MSVSQHTVDLVLTKLEENPTTARDLAAQINMSLVAVREALAVGRMNGRVSKLPGKTPAIYMHVPVNPDSPQTGEVRIVSVPQIVERTQYVPEIPYYTQAVQERIGKLVGNYEVLDPSKLPNAMIISYEAASREKRKEFLKYLFNLAEYYRQRDFGTQLRIEDVVIKK